jgi:hypothetical protein
MTTSQKGKPYAYTMATEESPLGTRQIGEWNFRNSAACTLGKPLCAVQDNVRFGSDSVIRRRLLNVRVAPGNWTSIHALAVSKNAKSPKCTAAIGFAIQ